MKTIWEVLIVISLAVAISGGIITLGEEIFTRQTLTDDSVNQLSGYSVLVNDYNTNYVGRLNETEIDPYKETDLNQVSEFVQEYRDYKGKLDQLKDGMKLVYSLPDLVLYAIPFVEADDMGVYVNIYRLMVWILIMLLIIVGLRNGQLIPQF